VSGPSLYVYAIAAEAIPLGDLTGVGREVLTSISVGACHAIAGAIEHPVSPDAETLRAQDALVRQLAARADALLPVRFGSRFADEAALRQAMEELNPGLAGALARVRGCEQMTIRLFADEGAAPASVASAGDTGPGTEYLRRRAAEARHATGAFDLLRAHMAAHVTDERIEHGRPPVIGSIHHLIPRGTAEVYRSRLDALAAPGLRLRVSGPSPAYAFAEAMPRE
jgi:Gas vesicle synthesis protein GvpL/GvpF